MGVAEALNPQFRFKGPVVFHLTYTPKIGGFPAGKLEARSIG